LHRGLTGFNRTFLVLKLEQDDDLGGDEQSFNRTFLVLKCIMDNG